MHLHPESTQYQRVCTYFFFHFIIHCLRRYGYTIVYIYENLYRIYINSSSKMMQRRRDRFIWTDGAVYFVRESYEFYAALHDDYNTMFMHANVMKAQRAACSQNQIIYGFVHIRFWNVKLRLLSTSETFRFSTSTVYSVLVLHLVYS